jgi:hypothetical protein
MLFANIFSVKIFALCGIEWVNRTNLAIFLHSSFDYSEGRSQGLPERSRWVHKKRKYIMFWVYILRCADGSYHKGGQSAILKDVLINIRKEVALVIPYTLTIGACLIARACFSRKNLVGLKANQGLEPQEERRHDAYHMLNL